MTRLDLGPFTRLLHSFHEAFLASGTERRIADSESVLGLVLHALSRGPSGTDSCRQFGFTPSNRSKYWRDGLALLVDVLRTMPEAAIVWPSQEQMVQLGDLTACRVSELERAFGALDGSLFSIARPAGNAEQRRYYSGYKCTHAVKCVFVFGSDGCIIWSVVNLPGSLHDSWCCSLGGLYDLLDATTPDGMCILADTAFQRGPHVLCTSDTRTLQGLSVTDSILMRAASRIVSKARILVEWSIGGLKSTFRILRHKLIDAGLRPAIFEACLRLWNFRVRTMAVSEVAKVFSRSEDLLEIPHDPSEEFNVDYVEPEPDDY